MITVLCFMIHKFIGNLSEELYNKIPFNVWNQWSVWISKQIKSSLQTVHYYYAYILHTQITVTTCMQIASILPSTINIFLMYTHCDFTWHITYLLFSLIARTQQSWTVIGRCCSWSLSCQPTATSSERWGDLHVWMCNGL